MSITSQIEQIERPGFTFQSFSVHWQRQEVTPGLPACFVLFFNVQVYQLLHYNPEVPYYDPLPRSSLLENNYISYFLDSKPTKE